MEFHELLNQLQLDINNVMERFSFNESLLKRFICKFPNDPTFNQLKEAMNHNDDELAKISVHTLKGIAANLGFSDLFSLSVTLLEELRNENLKTNYYFSRLEMEYIRITQYIQTYIEATNKKSVD